MLIQYITLIIFRRGTTYNRQFFIYKGAVTNIFRTALSAGSVTLPHTVYKSNKVTVTYGKVTVPH